MEILRYMYRRCIVGYDTSTTQLYVGCVVDVWYLCRPLSWDTGPTQVPTNTYFEVFCRTVRYPYRYPHHDRRTTEDNLPTNSNNPVPAMTAGPNDPVPLTTVALDSAPAMTAVLPPTEDNVVASGLPVDAAAKKKQARVDLVFGAERWGNRLGGFPACSMDTTYIHSKDLPVIVRRALFTAYQHITRVHGSALQPKALYERVANLFNIWHIGLVEQDGYGYGGKISEKTVEQWLKKEGRVILQGSLGGHVIPQAAAMPIHPQPAAMLERGPTQPVFYERRVVSSAIPSLTGAEIENLSQRDARDKLKGLALLTHGTVAELQGRLKKHYRI
jgi:hypothetical protein